MHAMISIKKSDLKGAKRINTICNHDNNHKVTEIVDTVYELVLSEGCETNGLERYTATFTNSLFETQTILLFQINFFK